LKDKKILRLLIWTLLILVLGVSFPWLALNLFGKTISGQVDSAESKTDHIIQGRSASNDTRTVAKSIVTVKYWFYIGNHLYTGSENSDLYMSCDKRQHVNLHSGDNVRIRYCSFLPYISYIECAEK